MLTRTLARTFAVVGAILSASAALADGPTLTETTWTLVDINGTPLESTPPATMRFETDRVGGTGICNGWGGTPEFTGEDGLTVNQVISTMMACPEPRMSEERAFFDALAATTRYHLEDGTLFLLDAEGSKVATFEAQP